MDTKIKQAFCCSGSLFCKDAGKRICWQPSKDTFSRWFHLFLKHPRINGYQRLWITPRMIDWSFWYNAILCFLADSQRSSRVRLCVSDCSFTQLFVCLFVLFTESPKWQVWQQCYGNTWPIPISNLTSTHNCFSWLACMRQMMCVRVCICACLRACVRACTCVCVRECVSARVCAM